MDKMMTKKELFEAIVNHSEITDEMVERAQACLDVLAKTAAKAKERRNTPAAVEKREAAKAERAEAYKALAEQVAGVLTDEPMTAAEIAEAVEDLGTAQKATRAVKLLVDAGRATAVEKDKKKAYVRA